MAGYRELLAVEWDDYAAESFRLNFPSVPVYHGDINQLTVAQCMQMAGLTNPGELDVFDGSPPCQGFSMTGSRKFDDDRNQLFRQYVRLLRGLQPKAFIMENVAGMIQGDMRLIFAEILRELKASGYKVSARLLDAKYFRVPQRRERMIFIGVREDLPPEPSHPRALSQPLGIPRADHRISAKSARRFGDVIEREGFPIHTITKIGRKFWSNTEEFGPLTYRIGGSFPIEYRFPSDSLVRLKQIVGNSVPPLFMRAIAAHVRTQILERCAP